MSGEGPFTSQLSINGFALCAPAEVTPIRQVVGNCVFGLHGVNGVSAYALLYSGTWGRLGHEQARGAELVASAAAYNEARSKALERLGAEAQACGANVVLDVRVRREELGSPTQAVEYLVTGTAVRVGDRAPSGLPVLVSLPVDDYWKLVRAGYEPVGIAAASTIYQTRPSVDGARALAGLRFREGRETREIPEFSDTVSGAVGVAMASLGRKAQALHASHVVGVAIERQIEAIDEDNAGRMPLSGEPAKRKHLRVTVHVLGTAIRDRDGKRGLERTERGTWREPSASGRRTLSTDVVIRL